MKKKIIICPNEEKIKILNNLNNNNLHSYKFLTKEEYLNNYYFSYNEDTIYYLIKTYNYNIDVCKKYLKYLYVVDIDKKYNNKKLIFLQNLKKELIDNKLLIFHNDFKDYLKDYDIEVRNYYSLDLYEEEALNYKFDRKADNINVPVYEFKTIEEEVNYVCIKIYELLNKGIDINKIFLVNITNDYLFTLKKVFNYYKIPLNIDMHNSIYGTKIVKDFLLTDNIDLEDVNKNLINKKIINILSSLNNMDNDIYKREILIDKLKNTYFNPIIYDNAVNIKDLYSCSFTKDEYVFVLGFNQELLPKLYQDIDYLNDFEKEEVSMYKSNYLNKREKEIVSYLLSNIPNLYLSYKLESPFDKYYRSSLINDLDLEIITDYQDNYTYSNLYNKIRIGEAMDLYYLYGEKNNILSLNNNYHIPYNTYSNSFTGIKNDTYLENILHPLKISYTSLNTYNECKFKYYLKYVLKIDEYQDLFAAFIGSLFHEVLSLYKKSNFTIDNLIDNYLEKRVLNLKEKLLLVRIRKEIKKLIEEINIQDEYTSYKDEYYEKEFIVDLDKKVETKFIGFIDKIMFRKEIEDTYLSIIDYKTGKIDTNIEPMKYGLHMQLPVYLYLVHYSKVISNPIFTGIYYQSILFDYPTWNLKLEKDLNERYLLKGYSTTNIDVLEKFDQTYSDSKYIKSLKYSTDKGFGTYSKVISNDELYNLITFTKKHIEEKVDEIIAGDFIINPKVYNQENISCKYCNFKDICYMKNDNIVYLDKVEDLSFLGGEA